MPPVPPGTVVVTSGPAGRLAQTVTAGSHRFTADEPQAAGGQDRGPDPYALLLAALGTCTAMTLRLYADRKGWPLRAIEVRLRHGRVYREDCEGCDDQPMRVELITHDIALEGDLDEPQRARLLEIAERCPVHRSLAGPLKVASRLV